MMEKENRWQEDGFNQLRLEQTIIHLKAELAKYKAKIQDYQHHFHYSQLEALKKENTELHEALIGHRQHIQQLKEEALYRQMEFQQILDAHIDREKKQLASIHESQTEHEKINNELANLKSAERKRTEELQSARQTNLSLQELAASRNILIEKLQKEKQILTETIEEQTTKLTAQNVKEEKLLLKIQELEKQVSELEATKQEAESSLVMLQNQYKQLASEKKQADEERRGEQAIHQQLFAQIEALTKETAALQTEERLSSFVPNAWQHQQDRTQLDEKIEKMLLQASADGEKLAANLSLIAQLEEHIDNLTDEMKQLKSRLAISFPHL
jgi:chromosome segregation ATPase